MEALKIEHRDPFQDFGIDPLGFLRHQATLFRRKRNRLSAVEFHQLLVQTATFFMEPFDFPLLVAFSPANQHQDQERKCLHCLCSSRGPHPRGDTLDGQTHHVCPLGGVRRAYVSGRPQTVQQIDLQ